VHLLDLCDQLKSPPPDISAHLLDTEFHKYIVSCSGNMRLIEFFTTMMESVYRLDIYNTKVGHNNPRETTHAEHTCIAQAIIAGDDQLIRKAYFDHINNSQLASITALRKIKTEKINISIKSKGDAALYEKAY